MARSRPEQRVVWAASQVIWSQVHPWGADRAAGGLLRQSLGPGLPCPLHSGKIHQRASEHLTPLGTEHQQGRGRGLETTRGRAAWELVGWTRRGGRWHSGGRGDAAHCEFKAQQIWGPCCPRALLAGREYCLRWLKIGLELRRSPKPGSKPTGRPSSAAEQGWAAVTGPMRTLRQRCPPGSARVRDAAESPDAQAGCPTASTPPGTGVHAWGDSLGWSRGQT